MLILAFALLFIFVGFILIISKYQDMAVYSLVLGVLLIIFAVAIERGETEKYSNAITRVLEINKELEITDLKAYKKLSLLTQHFNEQGRDVKQEDLDKLSYEDILIVYVNDDNDLNRALLLEYKKAKGNVVALVAERQEAMKLADSGKQSDLLVISYPQIEDKDLCPVEIQHILNCKE